MAKFTSVVFGILIFGCDTGVVSTPAAPEVVEETSETGEGETAEASALGFPRLGAHTINSQSSLYVDEDWLKKIGQYSDLTILNFYIGYHSLDSDPPRDVAEVVGQIRAQNPNALIGTYTNIDEISEDTIETCRDSEDSNRPKCALVEGLDKGTVKDPVDPTATCDLGYSWLANNTVNQCITDWEGTCNTNITSFVEPQLLTIPDGSGDQKLYDNYGQLYAEVFSSAIFNQASLDVWYIDIFGTAFRTHDTDDPDIYDTYADLDCDNIHDHPDGYYLDSEDAVVTTGDLVDEREQAIGQAKREAMAGFVEYVRQLHPGVYMTGNTHEWFSPEDYNSEQTRDYPEYDKLLDGGHVESVIGPDWAYSGTNALGEPTQGSFGSFNMALTNYRYQLAHQRSSLVQFQPVVYDSEYLSKDGTETLINPNSLRTLRYGLGMALLDDGFYTPNIAVKEEDFRKRDIPILDEYTCGQPWESPASTKWLGQPVTGQTGEPPMEPYQNGVWIREFDNGLVVVNPHIIRLPGESERDVRTEPETITLPDGDWKKFQGKELEDPHNDGQSIDGTLSIDPGDAYLLVREGILTPCNE